MRIKRCFEKLKSEHKRALIPYITAGDPAPTKTVTIMHQLVRSGGDIIELGFPFSDPVADGAVIAQAHERSLLHGVTLKDVLSMVLDFRETNDVTPIVLMGYLNPIEIMGYEQFAQKASAAGVDGVLVVDLPPEAAASLRGILHNYGLDMIHLIAPTTSDERICKICNLGSGYLYYVSLKGVTGAGSIDVNTVGERVAHIKKFTSLPVGVGFGIRDEQSAAAIARVADGVVVGSKLVSALAQYSEMGDDSLKVVSSLLAKMRSAMNRITDE